MKMKNFGTMKMKNIKILTTLLCMLLAMGYAQETHGSDVTTTFSADLSYTSRNPLQGWVIYAGLGDGLADNFWSQYDKMQSSEGTVKVSDYATTLFIRAAWTYFNPEEDVYAWQPTCNTKPAQRLRMLMEGAKTRNLRLAFSFITDSRDKHDNFTPQYVRDAGAKGFESTTGSVQVWSPYPDDPYSSRSTRSSSQHLPKHSMTPTWCSSSAERVSANGVKATP